MTIEIGGQGYLGLAFETAVGTYVAPTKFFPIRSESLQLMQEHVYRTNIRAIADRTPGVKGYSHVEGDVEFEVTRDALLYFMYASRVAIIKTGAMAPFTYDFAPAHVAKPTTATGPTNRKTLSILTGRGAQYFGYLGLVVVNWVFTLDSGMLIATASLLGLDEANQTNVAQTWPTTEPYGPGDVSIEVPSATVRTDIDTFTMTINENGTPENRVKTGTTPAFNRWGEREVTFAFEADFDTLTDYTAFKNQTRQTYLVKSSNNAANDEVTLQSKGSIRDSTQINLSSLGDLVRASIEAHATNDAADSYAVQIKTTDDIT